MLCVWVHGCDPGRVSDGSRLTLYQTLFIECPSLFFFRHVPRVIVPFFLSFVCFCFVFVLFCFYALVGAVDVPLIFFLQPRILPGYG